MSWLDLNLRGLAATLSAFAEASGAQLIRSEGLVAVVNPAVAERSVFNSVVYADPDALAGRYEELVDAYSSARCAWTVWVPEGDRRVAAMLGDAGHVLDAQPRAMGIKLEGFEEPGGEGIEWTPDGDVTEMAALNDAAYGFPPGTWIKGTGRAPEGLRVYVARVDGRPAATVCARDVAQDCTIWNVATLEIARGKGLATALMRRALFDAQARGCRSSTLQATKPGAPVYRRCGYEDFGALQMWESRPPELAAQADPRPAA